MDTYAEVSTDEKLLKALESIIEPYRGRPTELIQVLAKMGAGNNHPRARVISAEGLRGGDVLRLLLSDSQGAACYVFKKDNLFLKKLVIQRFS